MSRIPVSYQVSDISALAKSLRRQWAGREAAPSHVEMLNMLARASGHRNFQHLRAAHAGMAPAEGSTANSVVREVEREAPIAIDAARIARVAAHFDDRGRLMRWPGRRAHQILCLWALWARFPARATLTEKRVSAFLAERHQFEDAALLRREMVDGGLLQRNRDGSQYRRCECRPSAEAVALIRHLKAVG